MYPSRKTTIAEYSNIYFVTKVAGLLLAKPDAFLLQIFNYNSLECFQLIRILYVVLVRCD